MATRTTAQRLDAMEARQREILIVLARIERVLTGGAEDVAESVVVEALSGVFGATRFTSAMAIRKASLDTTPAAQALRDALESLGIGGNEAAKMLGHLLKRAELAPSAYVVRRVGDCHKAAWWTVSKAVLGDLRLRTPLKAS